MASGGTVRRYCPECGTPLPPTKSVAAVFCSGRCRSRTWRPLEQTRRRVAAMQLGDGANTPRALRVTMWAGIVVTVPVYLVWLARVGYRAGHRLPEGGTARWAPVMLRRASEGSSRCG
jgi:predicted nucleic acid-binding Zn ribbon protein